ncbi:class I SAM-dependent methyltransferase [Luedemannella helvata]|uniref:Methyltransferase n=1 Tax=Luedemannella helvata TaxID=349315 RepID=A0ABN2K962_9ACTN
MDGLRQVIGIPEIRLELADPHTGLWEHTDGYRSDQPPPFWAYAWPGGVGLARYVLDHPGVVAGRRVLDVGTGSGLVAIAAARAGAAHVEAVDSDPAAVEAVRRNAAANDVEVLAHARALAHDSAIGDAQVILAGDAFYSAATARLMLAYLRRAARAGTEVIVSDPGRGYLPTRAFTELATVDVVVSAALENATAARTTVWRLTG